MQYLLVDSHQRFLGTLKSEKKMTLGDVFQTEEAQTYTVVGVNQARQHSNLLKSLTVVRGNCIAKVAAAAAE